MPTVEEARRRTARFYLSRASRFGGDFRALDVDAAQLLNALSYAEELGLIDELTSGLAAVSAYLNSSGRRMDALRRIDAVLSRADVTGHQQAQLLLQRGLIMRYSGDLQAALDDLRSALAVAEQAGEKALCRRIEQAMGWLLYDQADLAAAQARFDDLLLRLDAEEDHDFASSVRQSLANVRFVKGDYAQARRLLVEALRLAGETANGERIGNIHQDLGWIDVRVGDLEAAQRHFEAGLAAVEDTGSLERRCNLLQGLGAVAEKRGEPERARELWEQALAVAIELRYPALVAGLLHNLGGVAVTRGEEQAAERYLTDALRLVGTIDEARERRSAVLATLGRLRVSQQRYGEARSDLEEGLELAQSIGYRWMEADILRSLGELELRDRNRPRAAAYLRRALDLSTEIGSESLTQEAQAWLAKVDSGCG